MEIAATLGACAMRGAVVTGFVLGFSTTFGGSGSGGGGCGGFTGSTGGGSITDTVILCGGGRSTCLGKCSRPRASA